MNGLDRIVLRRLGLWATSPRGRVSTVRQAKPNAAHYGMLR
jgi:hypothetical protein